MPLLKEEAYAMLIEHDGTRTELDQAAYEAVRATLEVLRGGKGQTDGVDPWLTTGQAAEMLGISRRTLTRMLDAGKIPYERHGTGHRRLRTSDVIRYKEESLRRKTVLGDMREHSFEGGLDDLDAIASYLEQLNGGSQQQ